MSKADVSYLVFDLEAISDGNLISRLRYPQEGLTPQQAVRRYRDELLEKYESDFVPYTYHLPISLAIGKVDRNFRLIDLATLDEGKFRPHIITEHFWRGWEKYNRPTFVSFNGRTYDLPVMELAAFRFGLSLPSWFNVSSRSYEQYRNRYNIESHCDLQELLTNFGSTRFTGGLNLASNLLGKPGKMQVQGDMVQDMYEAGRLDEISDYCRCDVLDTYFVFLRTRVLLGQLSLQQEQTLLNETKSWLQEQAETTPAYQMYLDAWSDWENPWEAKS